MVQTADRSGINFQSVDSNPERFATKIPRWRGLAVLGTFTILSFGLLWLRNWPFLDSFLSNHDIMFSEYSGNHSIAVRLFVLAFYISFSLFASATKLGKLLFALDMIVTYLMICAVFDLFNGVLGMAFDVHYSLNFVEIVSGIVGFAVYSFKLLERGNMPSRIRMKYHSYHNGRALWRMGITMAISAGVAVWVNALDLPIIEYLRNIALLGGIGPGVFLFLPAFFMQIYIIGRIDDWREQRDRELNPFTPPVTIIVPAHNEEYIIDKTIRAMDVAASNYPGDVRILIMDNNSTDGTAELARKSLMACRHARGRIIPVTQAGKSHALNAGLAAAKTEFLIRVDADTLLGPDNLNRAMHYFHNPRVGCVGGVPIPPGGGMFDSARLLEVLVKHGFYSVGMSAINCVVGIPGMFVCYRTHQPRQLGGFVQGMNGEDTDISLRIGEMGFHSIVDPKIQYVSEVPTSYTHMREQRMRWFRSIYHISSRCRDLIYSDWPTLRGKFLLPFMLVNSGRRAMLVPLLIFGLIEYIFNFNPASPVVWQALAAVLVGAPALVAVFAAFVNGRPRSILAMPRYLVFRLLRAYFTLESMLSITLTAKREDLARAYLENIVSKNPLRIA